jgi:uncharacterized membrane protein
MGIMRTASNDVVVYLVPDHPAPTNVPFELTNYVQPGDWRSRLTTAQRVSARYSKTLLERSWVVLMVIAAVAIPWGLSGIVWDLMMKDGIVTRTKVVEARLIGFALFVSVLVVFFIPILTWKLIGFLDPFSFSLASCALPFFLPFETNTFQLQISSQVYEAGLPLLSTLAHL